MHGHRTFDCYQLVLPCSWPIFTLVNLQIHQVSTVHYLFLEGTTYSSVGQETTATPPQTNTWREHFLSTWRGRGRTQSCVEVGWLSSSVVKATHTLP
jgi:hypothetical protein